MIGASFAYDTKADRFVLFGGWSPKAGLFSDQTWLYDLGADSWSSVEPSPAPEQLCYASFAYLPDLGASMLFGGVRPGDESPLGDSCIFGGGGKDRYSALAELRYFSPAKSKWSQARR